MRAQNLTAYLKEVSFPYHVGMWREHEQWEIYALDIPQEELIGAPDLLIETLCEFAIKDGSPPTWHAWAIDLEETREIHAQQGKPEHEYLPDRRPV